MIESKSNSIRTSVIIAFATLCLYLGIALCCHWGLIGQHFDRTNYQQVYQEPSLQHWMGTDFLGRDVLARGLQSTKTALAVGFGSATLATLIGLTLGLLAGYFRGPLDSIILSIYTILDSIPSLLLILTTSFVLGHGLWTLFIILGLVSWVPLCRMVRAETLKLRELEFTLSAQALGLKPFSILKNHLLPNLIHIVTIQFTIIFIFAVKMEVILSFLGLGVEPGTPSWGVLINDAKAELTQGVWWGLITATSLMFFLVFSLYWIADDLQKRWQEN